MVRDNRCGASCRINCLDHTKTYGVIGVYFPHRYNSLSSLFVNFSFDLIYLTVDFNWSKVSSVIVLRIVKLDNAIMFPRKNACKPLP